MASKREQKRRKNLAASAALERIQSVNRHADEPIAARVVLDRPQVAAPVPEVHRECSRLEQSLASLQADASALLERLSPVLRQVKAGSTEAADSPVTETQVGKRISEASSLIENVRSRIQYALDVLAV